MKYMQHMTIRIAAAASLCLCFICAACSNQPQGVCSLNFALDMTPLLKSRDTAAADGAVNYYLELSVESTTSSWKYDSGIVSIPVVSGSGGYFTRVVSGVPLGERVTVSLYVYSDNSASASSLLASGTSDPFITEEMNDVPFTLTVTQTGGITVVTPENRIVTVSVTSEPAAASYAYNDTTTQLTFTAACPGAASDAVYAWYVNGSLLSGLGSGASFTTTPSAFAAGAGTALNADGTNAVSVTVTENGIITGRGTAAVVFADTAGGTGGIAVTVPQNRSLTLSIGSLPSSPSFRYDDTTTQLSFTAACPGAASDAVYTWYVNGSRLSGLGSGASFATTPSAFIAAASDSVEINGSNIITVTVTENGVITARGTSVIVFFKLSSGMP